MKFCRVLLASIAACVWLTSCGGGGGGGDAASGGWLTFSPSAVDLTVYQGVPVSFTVQANSSKTIAERIYLGVIDTVGLITPNVEIVANTKTNYSATFGTNPNLSTGTHNSFLQVRICLDAAITCKLPYPDSPWQVPIRIKVLPATNLTSLTKLDGERPWGTINGNSAHNAYFSRPVAPENFTQRWVIPITSLGLSQMNIAGNAIISSATATSQYSDRGGYLLSHSEFDGKLNWKVDLGENSGLSSQRFTSLSDGRVAIVTRNSAVISNTHSPSVLRVFSATTGQLQGSSLPVFGASPFFAGNEIFLSDSYSDVRGVYRYDVNSGALAWKTELAEGSSGFSTPAADSRYVYVFHDPEGIVRKGAYEYVSVSGQLVGLDRVTGLVGFNITVPGASSLGVDLQVPVLGNNGMVFIESGAIYSDYLHSLLAFDTSAKTLKWTLTGNFLSNPVDAAGTLYIKNGQSLEARKPTDGALLWSWPIPEKFVFTNIPGNIIVVGNLVFLSGRDSTYAVDITTHQSVWSYPVPGNLAVSDNGILYIRSKFFSDLIPGKLVAFNLR